MCELCELCFVSKELLLEVKRMTITRIAYRELEDWESGGSTTLRHGGVKRIRGKVDEWKNPNHSCRPGEELALSLSPKKVLFLYLPAITSKTI